MTTHTNATHPCPLLLLQPEATIIFADIVGFTSWSSMREPSQVFTLLETIYHSLDQIANRRHVFKIETVGDCYVAVCGLPEPNEEHAIVMARFARDCLHKFNVLVKKLVVELGPDTEELKIRIGLHSGPVTAGVLRGERSRFQLFGDTVRIRVKRPVCFAVSYRCVVSLTLLYAPLLLLNSPGQYNVENGELWLGQQDTRIGRYGKSSRHSRQGTLAHSSRGSNRGQRKG
jgi:Adenylate and Guanylate cyclase catalytic domain